MNFFSCEIELIAIMFVTLLCCLSELFCITFWQLFWFFIKDEGGKGGGGGAVDWTFWTMCESRRRSVFYLQAYQGSMIKHTVPVCFTDLCSQIGLVLQTVAILGWRAPTFSYQFSSQCFIICQLIYAGI